MLDDKQRKYVHVQMRSSNSGKLQASRMLHLRRLLWSSASRRSLQGRAGSCAAALGREHLPDGRQRVGERRRQRHRRSLHLLRDDRKFQVLSIKIHISMEDMSDGQRVGQRRRQRHDRPLHVSRE